MNSKIQIFRKSVTLYYASEGVYRKSLGITVKDEDAKAVKANLEKENLSNFDKYAINKILIEKKKLDNIIHNYYIEHKEKITSKKLRSIYNNKHNNVYSKKVLDQLELFIQQKRETFIRNGNQLISLKDYNSLKNTIIDYQIDKKIDLSIYELDLEFIKDFVDFMRRKRVSDKNKTFLTKGGLNNKTLGKRLSSFKSFIRFLPIDIQRKLFTVFDKRVVCKLTRMSASAYRTKLNTLKVKCGISPLSLCLKRHPLQLAKSEVNKIKALFQDTDLQCWPAISLYYKGVRDRELYISKSTFYNYINILGLNRKWKKEIKKKTGIISKMPNEYLHVDTTFWKLSENVKAAIVFVSDNFSKKVLGWSVSLNKDANNVKQALEHAIATIHQYHPKHLTTILVADGGSENHNMTIDNLLLETTYPEISKVIAMKDISFSNSPIEAINKIMKRYLRFHKPETIDQLIECLELIVKDYNEKRPHGSLLGLTPLEAYTNAIVNLNFKNQQLNIRRLRILENKNTNCKSCN